MRHKVVIEKLGRNFSLRKATLRDIAKSVLVRQSIVTTRAKAKVSRKLIDRLVSLGKEGSLAAKRHAFSILCDHQVVKILFDEIAPRYQNRKGGYTRIFTLLERKGDGARRVVLELTEKIIKEKVKIVKPKKEEVKPQPQEIITEGPAIEERPAPPVKPKPEAKPKPQVRKEKPSVKPKPVAEKPREIEKPKEPEKKPEKKFFGGLGKLFRRKKES